jgi:hypothetical protein
MRLELLESSIGAVLRFLVSPWRRDPTRRSALPDEFDLPMISNPCFFLYRCGCDRRLLLGFQNI